MIQLSEDFMFLFFYASPTVAYTGKTRMLVMKLNVAFTFMFEKAGPCDTCFNLTHKITTILILSG